MARMRTEHGGPKHGNDPHRKAATKQTRAEAPSTDTASAANIAPSPDMPTGKKVTIGDVGAARAGRMKKIGGSASDDFNAVVGNQAVQSHWYGNASQKAADEKGMAALGGMIGLAPEDEIEGMLSAQLIATHNASMECFRRAMIPDQPGDARDSNLGQANRLTRSFVNLMQALDKRRGRGQQKVTVEHVHVHQGGQAIVGHVTHEQRIAAEETVRQVTHATGTVLPATGNRPMLEGVPGGGGNSQDGD